MKRREFVTGAGLAIAGLGWGGAAAATSPERKADPQGHHFKYSLAAYSYRDLLQGESPKLTLKEFIDDCAKFGLEGAELTSYYFPASPKDAYLYELKAHAFRQGLDVSGTAIGNDFGHPKSAARDKEIAHTKTWIEYAAKLGAPVIRVFAGHVKKDSSAAEAHRLMVSGLEECCAAAGDRGVHLALENHGGPTATADGLLRFVKDVKSPWFGVNLDTGNFHTDDIYGDLARLAPHAINVQVKVVTSGPDRKKQPTDFERLARILADAGYRGYVVLEYEEGGDPRSESERYLDRMRNAFEKASQGR